FVQSLLLAVVIFLGIQLLFPNRGNSGTVVDGKTLVNSTDIRAALMEADAKLQDVTANRLYQAYDGALKEEVKAKKLTEADAQARRIEASIITADAQYKAGVARNDTARMRNAYHTVVNLHNRLQGTPEWNRAFAVPDTTADQRFGWKEWSGESLYNKVVGHISERAKSELIWGFIPGGYALIDALIHLTGAHAAYSYGFAALLLAFLVRLAVFPLAQKQIMSGRYMAQLVPLLNDIKKQYEGDQPTIQRKTMELYSEYGVNPMSGCFPALVQVPLFITVYQCMLLYQFEFQKGTFLWINPDLAKRFPGFVAPNLGHLDSLLIVVYGVMMVVSTLMTPVSDPTQIKQQRLMGIGVSVFVTVMMFTGAFPVPGAFVLYWIFLLIFSSLQSWRAYRLPLAPLQKVNTPTGGVFPGAVGKAAKGKWATRLEDMMRQAQEVQAAKPSAGGPSAPAAPSTGEFKTGTPAKHKPKKRK
ncbi:membrane protein insertase YidC, partial [bacterium]